MVNRDAVYLPWYTEVQGCLFSDEFGNDFI